MANQRAADQVFIGIWVSATVAQKIELARGGTPRSQWLRDAIAELLRVKGCETTVEEVSAPNRVNLDRRLNASQRDTSAYSNQGKTTEKSKPSSKSDAAATLAAKKLADGARRHDPK